MARRRKDLPDVRAAIVDTANALFTEVGWEGATVNAVVDRLTVSKGAFYHYFNSKEDLLDAVIEMRTAKALESTQRKIDAESGDAIAKLNLFLNASQDAAFNHLGSTLELLKTLYQPQNAIIRQKMTWSRIPAAVPLLSRILRQGMDEGAFHIADPEEIAALILLIGDDLAELQILSLFKLRGGPEMSEDLLGRANLYFEVIERLLAAPAGSLRRLDREAIQPLIPSVTSEMEKLSWEIQETFGPTGMNPNLPTMNLPWPIFTRLLATRRRPEGV